MEYIVKRQHYGDRQYQAGEVRELSPQTAQHLVALGVLSEKSEDTPAKSVEAPKNKALKAPKNK